jgi:hypothetical protein
MLVKLRELKPNPMRDFTVDPMDEDRIEKLRSSIEENGFWGGVVCRKADNGEIQIAAGHTRIAAALAAGVDKADLFVGNGDMDDATMIRIYARENATQRGNLGTAQVGSVASAVRYIAKGVMTGVCPQLGTNADLDKMRGNLTSDKGIGQRAIVEFLRNVPDITSKTVEQALANLKASGDYARIISEVQKEVEQENEKARKELEEAEREQERIRKQREEAEERQRKAEEVRKEAETKAQSAKEEAEKKRQQEAERRAEEDRRQAEEEAVDAERRRKEAEAKANEIAAKKKEKEAAATTAAKAADIANTEPVKDDEGKATGKRKERVATFDHAGVAKHLKNAHQVASFRELVTGQGIAPFLPVKNQGALAKQIVALAKSQDRELTAAFIRENVVALVLNVKSSDRQDKKEAEERLLKEDRERRFYGLQREFCRSCRGMVTFGLKMEKEIKDWPTGQPIPILNEFRTVIEAAKKAIDSLIERT